MTFRSQVVDFDCALKTSRLTTALPVVVSVIVACCCCSRWCCCCRCYVLHVCCMWHVICCYDMLHIVACYMLHLVACCCMLQRARGSRAPEKPPSCSSRSPPRDLWRCRKTYQLCGFRGVACRGGDTHGSKTHTWF